MTSETTQMIWCIFSFRNRISSPTNRNETVHWTLIREWPYDPQNSFFFHNIWNHWKDSKWLIIFTIIFSPCLCNGLQRSLGLTDVVCFQLKVFRLFFFRRNFFIASKLYIWVLRCLFLKVYSSVCFLFSYLFWACGGHLWKGLWLEHQFCWLTLTT